MSTAGIKTKTYNVTILKLFETIFSLKEDQQAELLMLARKMAFGENRRATRKECHITVNYLVDNHLQTDNIKNISRTGIYVESIRTPPVGAKIVMSFSLEDFGKPLKVEGQIIWCDVHGFGAVFSSLTKYQQEMLGIVVERMESLPA